MVRPRLLKIGLNLRSNITNDQNNQIGSKWYFLVKLYEAEEISPQTNFLKNTFLY